MLDKNVLYYFTKEAQEIADKKEGRSSNTKRNVGIGAIALASILGGRHLLRNRKSVPLKKTPVFDIPKEVPSAVKAPPVVNPRVDYRDHMRRVGKDMGLDEDEFYEHFTDLDEIYDGDMAQYYGDLPDYLKSKGVDPTDFVNRFVPSWNKHFPASHQLEEFTSPIGSKFNPETAYTPGRSPAGKEFVTESIHPGIRRVSDKFPFFPDAVSTKTK